MTYSQYTYTCYTPQISPGMYKEAETVMKEAITLMPDKARFYFSLGVLLGKTERLEVCIILIDTISTVIMVLHVIVAFVMC